MIRDIGSARKRAYFYWRNKIPGQNLDYHLWNEDEFIEHISKSSLGGLVRDRDAVLTGLKQWESTDEYKLIVLAMREDKFTEDLLKLYDKSYELSLKEPTNANIQGLLKVQQELRSHNKEMQEKIKDKHESKDEKDGLLNALQLE